MDNNAVLILFATVVVITAIIYFGFYNNSENASGGMTLYVTNGTYGANTVWIINGSRISTVRVGLEPSDVKLSIDGRYAYVANSGDATVSVIDTITDKVVKSISVGAEPILMEVTRDGKYIYVLNENSSIAPTGGYIGKSTISVINTANFSVVGTIGFNISTTSLKASSMALVPNGTELYVAGSYDYNIDNRSVGTNESVWIVNISNNSVVNTLTLGLPKYPRSGPSLAPSNSGKYMYLTYGQTTLRIVTSNKAIENLDYQTTYPYVMSMKLSPNDAYMYESDFYDGQGHFESSFDVFNLSELSPATVPTRSVNLGDIGGIATTPDGKLIYITGYYSGDVMAISTSSYNVLYTVKTGSYPSAIAVGVAT
ncbi:MAG: hypothetical protein KGH71_00140 [Candidatus Micrarchaeota archaeon]|nr:hypothetical protein [Candidatus Micrarchaeota archaeon]